MITSCYFNFVFDSETVTIGSDRVVSATLTEEVSPIGDTVPINKLSLSVWCDDALYNQLIGAKQIDAYSVTDGTESLLGVFYISEQALPSGGVAKFELVDIIGKLDTETFWGNWYCSTTGTATQQGVSYVTYLNDIMDSSAYSKDSSVSGKLLGFVSNVTKREALQQFAIVAGAVINPTRSRVINIQPMPTSVSKTITAAEKITGHTLTMDDAVEAVKVKTHYWKYGYDSEGNIESKALSFDQAWSTTASYLYGFPFELQTIGGQTPEAYCKTYKWTLVRNDYAGITMTIGEDPFMPGTDMRSHYLVGYYREDITDELYTDYTAKNPDSIMRVKSISDAMFLCYGRRTGVNNWRTVANRVLAYYQNRYIDEGSLLPGTVAVGQMVSMPTQRGTLTGYVERVVTDLTGGGLQKVKIRGDIA